MSKMAEKKMNKIVMLVKMIALKAINTYDKDEDFEEFFTNELLEEVRTEAEFIVHPKKRNEGMPKKPLSAWIFFCKEERERIKKSGRQYAPTEMTTVLAQAWGTLKEKDKVKYQVNADEDKKRYHDEVMALPEEKRPPTFRKANKKVKLTGYTLFCKEHKDEMQAKYPGMKWLDLRKKINEIWKETDAEEKKTYTTRANRLNNPSEDENEAEVEVVEEAESEEVKTPPKKKGEKKKPTSEDDENEAPIAAEVEEVKTPKKKGEKNKKKPVKPASEDEDEEERPRYKTPAKAKPKIEKKKAKKPVSDSESE
jgi:hypothetical protein